MNGLGLVSMGLFTSSGLAAAAEQATGSDLTGIAAIIAASAGMVSAVGAIIIAWMKKPEQAMSPVDAAKDELLLKLLTEKLERDQEEDEP